jgi:hypothetical protein
MSLEAEAREAHRLLGGIQRDRRAAWSHGDHQPERRKPERMPEWLRRARAGRLPAKELTR